MHTSSPCTSSTRFCAHRTRPTALLFRALKASAPAILACMATSDQAAAGSTSSRPQRVQQVLQYVQEHPLTVTSQHMQYDAEPSTPLPACIEGLTPADVLPPGTPADAHIGRVIAGLLYVACGGLDHAHNLITPLCWGSWTAYSGNPIPNSPVSSEAAYVHAIVHRQEGHCIGEFGSGFSNANYWYRSAGEHPIAVPLLKVGGYSCLYNMVALVGWHVLAVQRTVRLVLQNSSG
eukprot:GHRR01018441.1.p1 GENE.GHRR01018441.1~~GHRR01018441.1.p1  ORF type:complete len:234 (+),score=41.77 GHRR01018441.1:195-896(+)